MAIIYIENTQQEMCVNIFYKLCNWEVKKKIGIEKCDFDAMQTGYIECLSEMFGPASDDEVISAFENGYSWMHIVDNIISSHRLQSLIKKKKVKKNFDITDDIETDNIVRKVTKEYVLENFDEVNKSLQNL